MGWLGTRDSNSEQGVDARRGARQTQRYPTNGIWTEFTIPLQTDGAPYSCFRVVSVKAVGAVSVGLIR
jgi:hypothetical protein